MPPHTRGGGSSALGRQLRTPGGRKRAVRPVACGTGPSILSQGPCKVALSWGFSHTGCALFSCRCFPCHISALSLRPGHVLCGGKDVNWYHTCSRGVLGRQGGTQGHPLVGETWGGGGGEAGVCHDDHSE